MIAQFDRFCLRLTKAQATLASCFFSNYAGTNKLVETPGFVRTQLRSLDPKQVRDELWETSLWGDEDLKNDHANLHRILWLAAKGIMERVKK